LMVWSIGVWEGTNGRHHFMFSPIVEPCPADCLLVDIVSIFLSDL
jgi:hypothetical protein